MEPIIELYKTQTPTLFSYINELSPVTPSASATAITPEQDVYSSLLLLKYLIGAKKYSIAKRLAEELVSLVGKYNKRSLDKLAAKVYFYWVRVHELNQDPTAPLRSTLLAAQRTAALRKDDHLQATLLTLLLRNYLQHNLYDQADQLVAKSTFPLSIASNEVLARWFYYLGRIRAVQLNYTEAQGNLQQAIRRVSDPRKGAGFMQIANKLNVVVELLMGEIPERSIFRQVGLKKSLAPYLEIVQAVRVGDLQKFNAVLLAHTATFTADSNYSLILRLRHNVIKTALRTISLSYSSIPLSLISSKLNLDSEEDAEYIVAKAIRDGVITARVDHEKGVMYGKEGGDVYATGEVYEAFDRRIRFLLELKMKSVKSMRYPLNVHSKELATAGEARERERELVKEIEGAGEDDMDGGDDMDSGY